MQGLGVQTLGFRGSEFRVYGVRGRCRGLGFKGLGSRLEKSHPFWRAACKGLLVKDPKHDMRFYMFFVSVSVYNLGVNA